LEDWERSDEQEWATPGTRRPGRKNKAHQDLLRGFEWKFNEGRKSLEGQGRRWSAWSVGSGVSPGTSRMNSVEDGVAPRRTGSASRKRSGNEGVREEEILGMVGTVQEE